jgi:hypothetical protein
MNMLFHEYELVRRAVGPDRFPPIDLEKYLASLEDDLRWIVDDDVRDRLRTILEQHGLPPIDTQRPTTNGLPPASSPRPWSVQIRRGIPSRIRSRLHVLVRRPGLLWLTMPTGFGPDHLGGISFGTDERALRFCLRFPRRPEPSHQFIETMQAVEISTEGTDGSA